jgi:hypothetical protein
MSVNTFTGLYPELLKRILHYASYDTRGKRIRPLTCPTEMVAKKVVLRAGVLQSRCPGRTHLSHSPQSEERERRRRASGDTAISQQC